MTIPRAGEPPVLRPLSPSEVRALSTLGAPRSRPGSRETGSPRRRRTAAALVALIALAGAFAVTGARRTGNDVLASRVRIGQDAANAPEPANLDPLAPFAFGVVGPVRGDHAALERALNTLGDVDLVVLLGDVTDAGTESEFLRLAATWRGRGIDLLAIPGERDRERMDSFQEFVSPGRWAFVRNECLFVGRARQAGLDADFRRPRLTFAFTTDADAAANLQSDATFIADDRVRRVAVHSDGRYTVETFDISRAPTAGSIRRNVELGLLFPLIGRHTTAHLIALALCAAMLAVAFHLAGIGRRCAIPSRVGT